MSKYGNDLKLKEVTSLLSDELKCVSLCSLSLDLDVSRKEASNILEHIISQDNGTPYQVTTCKIIEKSFSISNFVTKAVSGDCNGKNGTDLDEDFPMTGTSLFFYLGYPILTVVIPYNDCLCFLASNR
jgi:hypothetical protein